MSESKHTPGPWYFSKDPDAKDVIYALNGFEWEEICKMIGRNYKANVALIADAWQLPDLRREIAELKAINKEMLDVLKACEELQGDVLMEVSTSQRIFNAMVKYNEKLNKVIRKARGETE